MDAQAIRDLEPSLNEFLSKFAHCFKGVETRGLSLAYLRGLLSSTERKNVERIALSGSVAPRTLQEFLASYPWDEQGMRSQLHKIVAKDHKCINSVGIIDETSHVKKGTKTPGVQRRLPAGGGKSRRSRRSRRSSEPSELSEPLSAFQQFGDRLQRFIHFARIAKKHLAASVLLGLRRSQLVILDCSFKLPPLNQIHLARDKLGVFSADRKPMCGCFV